MSEFRSGYRLSRQAQDDLNAIADYLAAQNPAAADRVIHAIESTIRQLARQPKMGRLYSHLREGLRVFPAEKPADKYLVFYYEYEDRIDVSDVIHQARDWSYLLESGER